MKLDKRGLQPAACSSSCISLAPRSTCSARANWRCSFAWAPDGSDQRAGIEVQVSVHRSLVFTTDAADAPAATEQVILGDQKRIEVDTYAHFRISDPLRSIKPCARWSRRMPS